MTQFQPTRPPREHQMRAGAKARGMPGFFIMAEMGTGKSKIAIDEFCQLFLDGRIDRVLIVAGKGSYADWQHKHLPENVPVGFPTTSLLWTGGRTHQQQEELRGLMYGQNVLRVLIMNVEAFGASKTAATVASNFVSGGRTLIVCDESTKIRNTDARRTQVMIELGQRANYRRAMTGLATPKNPLDLWGQMKFLGLDYLLGASWYSFRARYCLLKSMPIYVKIKTKTGKLETKMRNIVKVVGYRNLDHLTEVIRPVSFRVLKSECLDLPPKIYERAVVEMTPEQRDAYRQMIKFATVALRNGEFASSKNAMGTITRLHQILCGFLVDETGGMVPLPSNRLSVMEDVIDEIEGKVIIWCNYRQDVMNVVEHLTKTYPDDGAVEYYGATSQPARVVAVQAFQDGPARFFVGTAATGGFGITLTACSNVIYYSNSFDLEHRLQSEDRCHRDGTIHPVTYVDLVVPKTVDVRILRTLIDKKNVADTILDGGIQDWLTMEDD